MGGMQMRPQPQSDPTNHPSETEKPQTAAETIVTRASQSPEIELGRFERSTAHPQQGATSSRADHALPDFDGLQRQRLEQHKQAFKAHLKHDLAEMGYFLPPAPPPLLATRVFETIVSKVPRENKDSEIAQAIVQLQDEMGRHYENSYSFLAQMKGSLKVSVLSSIIRRLKGWDRLINDASLSIHIPDVAPSVKEGMLDIEHFLDQPWVAEQQRGVLAIHVDEKNQQTILQIGSAEHGVLYITVPKVLRPEGVAEKSIKEVLRRIEPFRNAVDPMAVIDGSYQSLNFNEIFIQSRVIRAPSGNTSRLALNIKECGQRERLSVENTTILNSAPKSHEECRRIFPGRDVWHAWRDEANLWNSTVASTNFSTSQVQEASRESVLLALARQKNVIVIMAHCEEREDGQRIYMPDPAPQGSVVTRADLLANREQIAANAPFVYLFSCEAGDLSNLRNIASTLLECGAAGVVASQTGVDGIGERPLLRRLLYEGRGAPPIEDFHKAIREVNYLNMEVYLA